MAEDTYDLVRELVAGSTTFQSWVGAANAAMALDRVHWPAVAGPDYDENDLDQGRQRPLALVGRAPKQLRAETGAFASGDCDIMFQADVAPEDVHDHAVAMRKFTSKVDAICAEMMALGRTGGYLMVQGIAMGDVERESMRDAQNPHISQWISIAWGLR